MYLFPPLNHCVSHWLQIFHLLHLQLLNRCDQIAFHRWYPAHELVSSLLQLLDVAIAVAFLLLDQVIEPTLIRFQVQVLVHLFSEVFDLGGRAVGKIIEFGDGQIPIIFVEVEFLEDVPASLEVAINGIAIIINS